MEAKREQALVGLFVVIATGLLLATVFALSGAVGRTQTEYRAKFKNAAGLQPGAQVSFAGVKVGRVESMTIGEDGQIEFVFRVKPDTPVKQDSRVKIQSYSPLGENIVNISQGKGKPAESGYLLPSDEFFGLPQVAEKLEQLSPKLDEAVDRINARLDELKVTIERVNDMLNDRNRENVAQALENARKMLEENRANIKATIANVKDRTEEIKPLIEKFKQTAEDARTAINRIDSLIADNREDVRKSIEKARAALDRAESLLSQLDRTMNYNAENIDEILENIRITTENLKQFTDVIKSRPSTLIRSSGPPDRKPGEPPKN